MVVDYEGGEMGVAISLGRSKPIFGGGASPLGL
jgi:hypothetical protein